MVETGDDDDDADEGSVGGRDGASSVCVCVGDLFLWLGLLLL